MEQLLEVIGEANLILLNSLSFLVGIFIGNRVAIGRDKRKEFNDAVTPVRAQLISMRDNPTPYHSILSGAEIDFIQHYMLPLRRWRFGNAIKRHARQRDEQMRQYADGQAFFEDGAAIARSAAEILGHLKLR